MTNLSGFWVGHFANEGIVDPVDFDVEITQTDHLLTGLITEPNSFDKTAGELLTAELSGAAAGTKVIFLKTYFGDISDQPPISYSGELDNAQQTISGVWSQGGHNGTFEMRRDGPAIGVKAKTTAATLEQVLEKVSKKDL